MKPLEKFFLFFEKTSALFAYPPPTEYNENILNREQQNTEIEIYESG